MSARGRLRLYGWLIQQQLNSPNSGAGPWGRGVHRKGADCLAHGGISASYATEYAVNMADLMCFERFTWLFFGCITRVWSWSAMQVAADPGSA